MPNAAQPSCHVALPDAREVVDGLVGDRVAGEERRNREGDVEGKPLRIRGEKGLEQLSIDDAQAGVDVCDVLRGDVLRHRAQHALCDCVDPWNSGTLLRPRADDHGNIQRALECEECGKIFVRVGAVGIDRGKELSTRGVRAGHDGGAVAAVNFVRENTEVRQTDRAQKLRRAICTPIVYGDDFKLFFRAAKHVVDTADGALGCVLLVADGNDDAQHRLEDTLIRLRDLKDIDRLPFEPYIGVAIPVRRSPVPHMR